jgi:EAL domain-containing protein (putative c-di-GMP-specific phosphodiesterase class I)
VLGKAAEVAAEWNRRLPAGQPLSVSVNLSARQLDRPDLAEGVAEVLRRTGLDPSLLHLELTESILMGEGTSTKVSLDALEALGVRLSVDDFGTGYSSLLYLRQFPVDVLKIDRSFVAGLGVAASDSAIVRGVVDLAGALGLTAVAEGVETEAQLEALQALGCELAQGYFWCRPLPADELEAWMAARPPACRLTTADA